MDEPYRIIGVGDNYLIGDFRDEFSEISRGKVIIENEVARDVTRAVEMIEAGGHSGILITDLALPNGKNPGEYNVLAKEFSEFDSSPRIWYSGGLYVVKRAIEGGLVTVVSMLTGEREKHFEKAGSMGAVLVDNQKNILRAAYEVFNSKRK
jgi:hypothetical protein